MKEKTSTKLVVAEEPPSNQDESKIEVSFTPTKKGGSINLPLGGRLSVPSGVCGKKDTITCQVAGPTERWRYAPEVEQQEHVTGEIFVVTSSLNSFKKSLTLQLPYYYVNLEYLEIRVKTRLPGSDTWVAVEFSTKEDSSQPMVIIDVDQPGVFVVVFAPKKEPFDAPMQGCIYTPRLHRNISVRFPKKAVDTDTKCYMQILTIPEETLNLAIHQYPLECSDLLLASEFVDIIPEVTKEMRRSATIKLPLPAGLDSETDDVTDISVLQKNGNGWDLVDSSYKFTKATVSFDVRKLSRFCVINGKPDRKKRMKEAMPYLEDRLNKSRGEILLFISLEEKSWAGVVECVPDHMIERRTVYRESRGYKRVHKLIPPPPPEPERLRTRRASIIKEPKRKEPDMEISDGMVWKTMISGDLQFQEEKDLPETPYVHYYEHVKENYCWFKLEPTSEEERSITATVDVRLTSSTEKEPLTISFKVDISGETVADYFRPEYVPEPVVVKPNFDLIRIPNPVQFKVDAPPKAPVFKPLPPEVMERLTRTHRKPIIIEKESKSLSGRSLMTLSKVVQEGLTMAVHLDLPDSTITGIGFDALANGLGMTEVTYRILLYWKRQQRDKKDGAVNMLALALRDMGRLDIATVLLEKHGENKEITLSCFNL